MPVLRAFWAFLKGLWFALDGLRQVLHLVLLLFLFGALFAASQTELPFIPGRAALGLDMTTGEFVHFKADPGDPNSLTPGRAYTTGEDSTGTVWVGTNGGLNRYNPSTKTFTRFYQDIAVTSIYHDRREGTWLGTSNGVWYYSSGSIEGEDPEIFRNDPASSDNLSNDQVGPIYEDQQGFFVGGHVWGRAQPAGSRLRQIQPLLTYT